MLIILIRALTLYLILMFCLRLMGKRQLGELQPTELVVTILISNIASLPIEDTSIPMILGIVPILAFVGFELILSNISLQSKKFRHLVSGKTVVVMSNGEIDQKQLRKLRFSIDDLMEALRQNNIFDIKQVEYIVVETTGKVSALQKYQYQCTTPNMFNIKDQNSMPPYIVISDGKFDETAMRKARITEFWITKKLVENKKKLKDVFIMTIDADKKYHIINKER